MTDLAAPGRLPADATVEGDGDWASYVTARATAAGVEATPTVLVAGAAVRPQARPIAAAVARAAGGR